MKLIRPRTSLSINIWVLRILGVWFPEENHPKWKTYTYMLYAILTQGFLFYLYTLSETISTLSVFGDIEKMAESSFLLLTHYAQLFKNHFFYKYSTKIVEFFNELDSEIFQPKNANQLAYQRRGMRRAKSDSVILLSMAFITCMLWAIVPFLENNDGSLRLPLSGWYPFPLDNSFNFALVYCYQVFGVVANAFTNISMDTTATGLFVHICAQLDILGDALKNMKRDAIKSLTKKKYSQDEMNYNKNNKNILYSNEELEQEMINTYKNCVLHHEQIIRYAEDIEESFNLCFLAQFSASLLIICLTFFKIVLLPSFLSIEFVSLLTYQFCIVFELLLYCWHGNEMILKSTSLCDAVYKSSWYEFSPKFSRDIILLMVRTKRPIRATSGKFFLLSLSTFTSILRLSWSFFAVLNSMHNKA